MEYSEGLEFIVGKLFDDELTGCGWVDLSQTAGNVSISAGFVVARDHDYQFQLIIPEERLIHGDYYEETNKWEFWVGR